MFFTKEDVSLFGENYISEGLANGTIYAIDNDTYINSEDVENALKKFKIVEVLTPNGKEYCKREIALIEKEKGSLYVVSGVFVSPEYFEKGIQDGSIIVCDICGDYEFKSESAHIETGINVCKRCARRSYAQCEDCGKWYPKSLIINVGGHKYCGGCISSHAYQCPHCGRYHLLDVPRHTVYVSNFNTEEWCDNCYNNDTTECCDCHRTFASSSIGSDHRCYECRTAANRNYINSYGYRPTPIFYGANQEGDNGLFYGIELETDKGDASKFSRDLRVVNEVYCKHDGSLSSNGCEVVSHPATLTYHMNSNLWQSVNNYAIQDGMRSHDTTTCGFHIHISRKPFKDNNVSNYEEKIALAFEKFWPQWVTFSRRKESSLNQWASRYDETTIDGLREEMKYASRYHSVNVRNANTIEIRIFRGTLKVETIKATIWAVANIAERILAGWSPESATTFRELFDMDNAPSFFTEYLDAKNL